MAFSGLDVVSGFAGGKGAYGGTPLLLRSPKWSENVVDGGVSVHSAPGVEAPQQGEPVIRFRSSVDGWVAIRRSPDASPTGARMFAGAGTLYDVIVEAGDKVAFSAGSLTGLHVVQALAGGRGWEGAFVEAMRIPRWSETLPVAGATTKSAERSRLHGLGEPVFVLRSSADAFVAAGPNPDASTGPKFFIPADEEYFIAADQGDRVAYASAGAFSGVHIAACYAGSLGARGGVVDCVYRALWSETLTSAGTTVNSLKEAPRRDVFGDGIFRVFPTVDGFVTVVQAADPTSTARMPVTARETYDVFASQGDRLAWQPA